jgi:hypothetical protein
LRKIALGGETEKSLLKNLHIKGAEKKLATPVS